MKTFSWLSIWSIVETIPCAFEKKMCSAMTEWSFLQMFIRSSQLIALFDLSIPLLIFWPLVLSVLKAAYWDLQLSLLNCVFLPPLLSYFASYTIILYCIYVNNCYYCIYYCTYVNNSLISLIVYMLILYILLLILVLYICYCIYCIYVNCICYCVVLLLYICYCIYVNNSYISLKNWPFLLSLWRVPLHL